MVVTSIIDGNEASKAGVKVGCIVTHLGGTPVSNLPQFKLILQKLKEKGVGSCAVDFTTTLLPPYSAILPLSPSVPPSPPHAAESSDYSHMQTLASTPQPASPQSNPRLVASGLTHAQFESLREEGQKAMVSSSSEVEDLSTVVAISTKTATVREAELLARCVALEAEAAELRSEVDRWRLLTSGLLNTLVLSPENCEYYKRVVREQLSMALKNVSHEVHYVDCSFPSSPANAPNLRLKDRSMTSSEWDVSWKPSWSAQVGQVLVQCLVGA
jgi:hypothetical protein